MNLRPLRNYSMWCICSIQCNYLKNPLDDQTTPFRNVINSCPGNQSVSKVADCHLLLCFLPLWSYVFLISMRPPTYPQSCIKTQGRGRVGNMRWDYMENVSEISSFHPVFLLFSSQCYKSVPREQPWNWTPRNSYKASSLSNRVTLDSRKCEKSLCLTIQQFWVCDLQKD